MEKRPTKSGENSAKPTSQSRMDILVDSLVMIFLIGLVVFFGMIMPYFQYN